MSTARPLALLVLGSSVAACSSAPDHSGSAAPTAEHPVETSREALSPTISNLVAQGRFKNELWRLNLSERLGTPTNAHRLSLDGDLVLVEDQNHEVHALDRDSGVHRWMLTLSSPTTQSVGGTPSTVTFVSTDEVVGVARETGARRQLRSSQHIDFFPSARAVTVGTSAYIGRLAPMGVQSINLTSGATGWEYATKSPVMDLVAHGDGALARVIGITEDGLLFSLPPRPASESTWAPPENWYRRLPGTTIVTPLGLAGNSLSFGTENGFLYHVDARSGQVRWKVPCGEDMRGNEPVIAGNAIFVRSSGSLRAMDGDSGHELWKVENGRRLITRLGDLCYVDMGEGHVSVRSVKGGAEVASFDASGLRFVPTVQGGGVFIGCDGPNVFALN